MMAYRDLDTTMDAVRLRELSEKREAHLTAAKSLSAETPAVYYFSSPNFERVDRGEALMRLKAELDETEAEILEICARRNIVADPK